MQERVSPKYLIILMKSLSVICYMSWTAGWQESPSFTSKLVLKLLPPKSQNLVPSQVSWFGFLYFFLFSHTIGVTPPIKRTGQNARFIQIIDIHFQNLFLFLGSYCRCASSNNTKFQKSNIVGILEMGQWT